MGPICPECQTGKHENCDGVGGYSADDELMIACQCLNGEHPHRTYFTEELFGDQPILDGPSGEGSIWGEALPELVEPNTTEELGAALAKNNRSVRPENDPGIWGEAFPELIDDHYDIARLAPQRELITDLMDVEVMNSEGEWVPMIPLPLYLPFWLKQCHCGKRFWSKQSYMEHYAYAHILGMEK